MNDDAVSRRRNILLTASLPTPTRPARPEPLSIPPLQPARLPASCPRGAALIATRNFLPYAKLAAGSFLAHHPDFRVFLLLVDGSPEDAAFFPEGSVFTLADLNLQDAGWYTAKFTAAEFSNALKPTFLLHLAQFVERVVYLDADIAVFSPLSELLTLLDVSALVLIPAHSGTLSSTGAVLGTPQYRRYFQCRFDQRGMLWNSLTPLP